MSNFLMRADAPRIVYSSLSATRAAKSRSVLKKSDSVLDVVVFMAPNIRRKGRLAACRKASP